MENNIKPSLVSILIPCFNMEDKIGNLLDSILRQTYKNLHVVIVNDGSTDNSEKVIESYKTKFQEVGIEIEYVYQTNRGLGGAINTALKKIKGNFFCWPDADDTLTDDSVEKRVRFLENNPEYAFVRSDANVFVETDLKHPIGRISKNSPNRFKEVGLMEDYILERDVIFCPGCHMVKTESFKEVNPEMDIYEGRRGQNYQLLLPLLYKFRYGFIDECLYNYIIYTNSMSRGDNSFEKCVERYDGLQSYILETLKRMEMKKEDYEHYCELTRQKYYMLKARKAFAYGLKDEYKMNREKLNDSQLIKRIFKLDIIIKFPFGLKLAHFIYKLRAKILSDKAIY